MTVSYRTGWIRQTAPWHPMMSSPWAAAVFMVAAALSLCASAVLVVRLERVGARLGLSEALLGLVAALAADTPEVTSAVTALAHGQHDVGTGVVLGSNVFNLAALIGLGAVVAGGIKLHRRVVLFEGTVALWIAALSIAAARCPAVTVTLEAGGAGTYTQWAIPGSEPSHAHADWRYRPVTACAGVASKRFLRLVHIRCSWRMPIQVISGPSSRKPPLGRTWPDHRIRVPVAVGSNVSV